MSHKFAQSTSLLQTAGLFSWVRWKKLIRRMQSLKIATILIKEVNPSVDEKPSLLLLLQICFSWVTWKKLIRRMQSLTIVIILRKEVPEKNVEFENSDNLTEENKSQAFSPAT